MELDQTDLGLLHAHRPPCALDHGLCQDQAVHQLAVFYRPADLLDDADVPEVDVIRRLEIYRLGDCVDGHGAEEVRILRDDLGGEGGVGGLEEGGGVCEGDGL